MDHHRQLLADNDPEIAAAIGGEEARQRDGIELIPSENYTYPEVLAALGTVLTNKYAEGYPGRRYYGGQQFTDRIEDIARERAQALFRAEHANVQPLSGSAMNQAAYLACLQPGDTVLAMDLSHGGHLTHGAPVSHMGRLFNFVRYKTRHNQQGAIDYDALMATALEVRPKLVLCGFSSYPRELDYAAFRRIADAVGALAMADIAHIGGLVAAGALRNPLDDGFDIVTTTVHKSLRGPRAGLLLCRSAQAKAIDASVFPGLQGGPHMHTIAATAVALRKAAEPAFRDYARQVLANAQALATALLAQGVSLITGGTDNHLLVLHTIDSFGLDGRRAEEALDRIGIAANKQVVPDDPRPPLRPSGLRIGTPAATTRGMGEAEMHRIAGWMVDAMRHPDDAARLSRLADEVRTFCRQFPLPGVTDARAA
ncbi:MAG TPA: serine hydroxymethyltransferase [Vineibacter terrae]|nr:serine hydroxymethyltransferase [Vineibacter terrae]HEX2891192.1 serine hydroxymethyltransferase [Vineibacter terrae]